MSRAKAHADVFRAIADPTRRAILDRLRAGAAPVNVLAEDFAQTRPAISKHLRVLREAALVTEQRSGRERLYQLEPQRLQRVASWVEGYRAFWLGSLQNLKSYLEDEK
jgi:DNA-binding transcriptional ArsR family regulator